MYICFAKANKIAKQFTYPFVISTRKYNGECSALIGTCVLINDEGYFVTAFHVLNQIQVFKQAINEYYIYMAEINKVKADTSKSEQVKKSILGKMRISANALTHFSVWLGNDNFRLDEKAITVPEIDLAICKIQNFEKDIINKYPKFKDASKDMDTGTSLCKLGFPFHKIEPTFEEATGRFKLPEGTVPLPLFPIEGIFTRTIQVKSSIQNTQNNQLLKMVETSSPGLLGQSGGPTFDVSGTIWAIQSSTQHLKLGFGINNNNLPHKEVEFLKNQYLHVGWGIHSETIINVLKQN